MENANEKIKKQFRISISIDETFSVEELWPDGNAPENPTVKDVIKLIKQCGGAIDIINHWNLDNCVECVVWNGKEMEYL